MNAAVALPMNRARHVLGLALMFLMTLFLTACGGGGSDTPAVVLNPPVVTTQPAARTVADGATANFSVVATSSTPLTYQWRKNGTSVAGATTDSLTVAAPYSDNAASYSVVVSNTDGSVTSADAVLTVTPVAPTINAQPLSLTVQAGGSATFSVAVSGGTGPVSYHWRKNGVDIAGATAASYTIAASAVGDAGAFTVAVVSPSGTLVSSAATLMVSTTPQPPGITAQPANQTVALGQTATFSVAASSSSAINYQWRRNAVAIVGATASTYTTPAAAAADEAAQFSVVVSNSTGSTTSAAATLTISNLPSVSVSVVSAGLYHSVALKSNGTVWSWGYTGYGLMGVGSDSVSPGVPTQAKNADGTTFTGAVRVSAGGDHTMAVKSDATVWGWGNNGGALGDGSTTQRTSPVQVKDAAGIPFTTATEVSAGQNYTLAVKADGSLWSWGYNGYSTLGDGTTTTRLNPVPVLGTGGGGFTGVSKVAAGQYHAIALKTDGTAWSWGYNAYGELGNGSVGTVALPVRVDVTPGVALASVVSVGAGLYHSVAVTSNGNAYAWGYNANGALGDGTTTNRNRPALVKDLAGNALTGIVAAVAGDNYSMFLKSDGTLWATGYNNIGQLGDNTTTAFQINPTSVKDAAGTVFGNIAQIALTQTHAVVRRSDGSVWSWGYNGYRQLGDTSNVNRRNPVQVPISSP